ncbi:sigma-70 RNA polymerase sigma factor region 4 domain-containing protein [Zhenhengia yiwuensis]|uniref:Sigma-70 family RNA polymerase sigma factor n=1 Tax=Zhenhengia yiwuensis TaxID=2763666 RepID=A0A926EF37_9FIRM|nr:siderophore-interacting protein [Zhenhengia yiwuensis]MBC8579148.1 sigma-70 family RNA polymerase sigma factor [Zhenhengia yiwuensis]
MDNNLYCKVEGMLYSVPKLKIEIDNLKIDLEELMEYEGIRGASDNEKAGSPTYAINSSVENEVVNRMEKLADKEQAIIRKINSKERELKRIENALSILTEGERLLIEFWYFKRYTVNRICDLLEISDRSFSRRRKNIIIKRLIPIFMA